MRTDFPLKLAHRRGKNQTVEVYRKEHSILSDGDSAA